MRCTSLALLTLTLALGGCVMIPMAIYGIAKAAHQSSQCEKAPDRCKGKYDGDPKT